MHQSQKKKSLLHLGILAFLLISALLLLGFGSLYAGAFALTPSRIAAILWSGISGGQTDAFPTNEVAVLWEIRMPRILCGMLVGSGLAVAGTIFQAILRNPLADPYTLGVSTGAAFGASLAIFCSFFWGIVLPVTGFAMASAFITLVSVIAIAKRGGGFASQNLILSGIIISSILSSGLSFLKMAAGENVGAIVFWLMGSLSSKHWSDVALLAPVIILCSLIAFYFANDLDIMLLGDETAHTLGVHSGHIRILFLVLGALITASCVSVSGIIGFVGLVVPHILRLWITAQNRVLLPFSALLGALLLSAADNAARLLFGGSVPVGVLTTLIGGPFFILLFIRRKHDAF